MAELRIRPPGVAVSVPFWLGAFCAFAPTSIGYQDLAGVFARQPGVSENSGQHLIGSPFGTIHAATFSAARPIGTEVPEPIVAQPINFNPHTLQVKTWLAEEPPLQRPAIAIEYPTVNRALKGDRLPLPQNPPGSAAPENLPQLQPIDAPPAPESKPPPAPAAPARLKSAEEPDITPASAPAETASLVPAPLSGLTGNAIESSAPAPAEHDDARASNSDDDVAAADKPPEIPTAAENEPLAATTPSSFALSFLDEDPSERNAQLYFGGGAMGAPGGLEQWAPGAEPVLVSPALDGDIKLAALQGPAEAGAGGETVAGKNDASRLFSPADRLGLAGKARAKAEKCLADAVYFEARGEPVRGQEAVAQVVMNRVFSGYYPNDVCGVVYQNANRYLACQFTFACEGHNLNRIDEPDMWTQAKRIAKDTLDGKIWLAEVGHATHYHAYWVRPSWVNEMKRMYKLGVHTFYRPRAWGDGSDTPVWGAVPNPAGPAKPDGATSEKPDTAKEAAAAKRAEIDTKLPEATTSPLAQAAAKSLPIAKL